MINSKERDSGGFGKNAESNTAPPEIKEVGDGEEQADPLINTLFADKYLIQQTLGAGGMSVVYLARHEALNKLVAIKTLHTHLTSKTSSLMRFKQEAQAASRLQHPGIVAMHDYGITEDGTPYLVMDYVSGESLADTLSKLKSVTHVNAMNIFKQTVAAIAHAHQRGIVHRDIKPSNIMLTFDEQNNLYVKIVDFGVAKFVQSEEEMTKLTQTGEALGSPLYMSPEQCLGQQLDFRSDIYSFGCVMYEAITGEPALAADGVFKTMMKHIHDVPPSFKEVRPDLTDTEALERIVFKALAKDPAKRYQSMEEMLADLNAVHEQDGIAQKIKNKFALSGLRQTTKSINFLVAGSLLIGAVILFGANCIISTIHDVSAVPSLMSENVVWPAYADKPSGTEIGDDQRLRNSMLGIVIDQERQSVSALGQSGPNKKLSEFGFSLVTKADSERKHHEYDVAEATYTEAIGNITSLINRTDEIEHAQARDKLMLAYLGKGDCEYFKSTPDYAAASNCYAEAVKLLDGIKNSQVCLIQPEEQLYLYLRNADALHLQGKYAEASGARAFILERMRSVDQIIRDKSYQALTKSKVAEEAFRQNQLADAKESYQKALADWQQDNDKHVREQAIATGRLAEIDNLQNSGEADNAFIDFNALAQKLERDDPKMLRTQFFANAYQAYASYLWQHHDVIKALEMHQRSLKYRP